MDYHAAKAFILDLLERKLSPRLTYHGLHHTLDVLHTTEDLCYLERLGPYETLLIKTAALYHDAGFTRSNQEHEARGCDIARETLGRFNYSQQEIDLVCGMIMATKIPQHPQNKLEEILCDADLDYLGRDDFYRIGRTLYHELLAYDVLQTEEAWNKLQVNFLRNHQYFTPTNQGRRAPRKARHLRELEEVVDAY